MAPRLLLLLALAVTASACAGPSSYYYWGSYNQSLYSHYKAPQEREAWLTGLKTTLLEAEQRGARVPPGLYAEYGYALFEEGDATNAIANFRKESALWPESRFLMEKMIRNAEQKGRQPAAPAQGPAGALEKS
jgi:hypothetical protein